MRAQCAARLSQAPALAGWAFKNTHPFPCLSLSLGPVGCRWRFANLQPDRVASGQVQDLGGQLAAVPRPGLGPRPYWTSCSAGLRPAGAAFPPAPQGVHATLAPSLREPGGGRQLEAPYGACLSGRALGGVTGEAVYRSPSHRPGTPRPFAIVLPFGGTTTFGGTAPCDGL